ncbi:MAG: LytTR family DNA-binding domain-containing protein [Bacteroidales bacterium]|jgi:two-component system LytT family response regulator|nr:LytTR family DNA-binding domain-containing protein [Bacteroidales bacterium]
MNNTEYIALVVDDERLARKELIGMLSDYTCIKEIHEADDVSSAIKMIDHVKPNLIFLDIQMPGETGFDLLNQIEYAGKIIFVTAYDQYAIRAFEVNAMDYLLKPVTEERLKKSINKLEKEKIKPAETEYNLKYNDRLFLTLGSQLSFIKISSIITIESEGDYTRVYIKEGKKGLVSKSMKEWELRLPANYFCRIHRATIVNLEFVENIEKWFNYSYRLHLKGKEEPYIISRRYAKQIKEKFG